MDGNIVLKPERQIRQIRGDNLLRLTVERAAFFTIRFDASFIKQRIELPIAIAAAIGSGGRNFMRAESVLEKVGIGVQQAQRKGRETENFRW